VVVVIVIAAIAIALSTRSTHANVDCSGDWMKSTDEEGVWIPCTQQLLASTSGADDPWAPLATAQTWPTYVYMPDYTPVPALPEQDDFKVIEAIPFSPEMGAVPFNVSGVTTFWRDGSVPTDDYMGWHELYVLTRPGNGASYIVTGMGAGAAGVDGMVITTTTNPTLETMVGFGTSDSKYQKAWTDPQADGALYITNITNPDYTNINPSIPYPGLQSVVSFTTKSGQTGHFDMSTEKWTFDTMSGQVATPTAPPAYP
jgi:hypothetical protein